MESPVYELGFLVAAGALEPGERVLLCSADDGVDYYAGLPFSRSIRASVDNLSMFCWNGSLGPFGRGMRGCELGTLGVE